MTKIILNPDKAEATAYLENSHLVKPGSLSKHWLKAATNTKRNCLTACCTAH